MTGTCESGFQRLSRLLADAHACDMARNLGWVGRWNAICLGWDLHVRLSEGLE